MVPGQEELTVAVAPALPFQLAGLYLQTRQDGLVKADARALAAIDALKQARAAEAAGLDFLADLVAKLTD